MGAIVGSLFAIGLTPREIAATVRAYRQKTLREMEAARDADALERVLRDGAEAAPELRERRERALDSLDGELREELGGQGQDPAA